VRSQLVCLVTLVAFCACTLPLPARDCGAPIIYPMSQHADTGVAYTPSCLGYTLDFDARLWFPTNNDDALKICSPGDTVTLIDTTHVRYVHSDGTLVAIGPPVLKHRLGCA
jgi:hypothetical protein